jgi:hypothetical protein
MDRTGQRKLAGPEIENPGLINREAPNIFAELFKKPF